MKAVDDLRDMADAIEEAADVLEETAREIDTIAPGGVRMPKKAKRPADVEEMERRAKAFASLLPSKVRHIANVHLGLDDTPPERPEYVEHDEATCPLCVLSRGEAERGWLADLYQSQIRREVRRMVAEGEISVVAEVEEVKIRSDERKRLYEEGKLAPISEGAQ